MILGLGSDIVDIRRIEAAIVRHGERFLDRVFTPVELAKAERRTERIRAATFAKRFAAKEAAAKALGTGISQGVNWLEIEVVREPGGRPTLSFHGRAADFAQRLGVTRSALSLTHSGSLAICLTRRTSTATPSS